MPAPPANAPFASNQQFFRRFRQRTFFQGAGSHPTWVDGLFWLALSLKNLALNTSGHGMSQEVLKAIGVGLRPKAMAL